MARIADEHWSGPHPEPFINEIELGHRWRWLQPVANLIDRYRRYRALRQYADYHSLRPKPRMCLPNEWHRLFLDRLGVEPGEDLPIVDEQLIRDLLTGLGEVDRVNNAALVREMVEAAQSPSGRLDVEAIVNAIGSDLGDWEVACEDRFSTFFQDVFGTMKPWEVEELQEGGVDFERAPDVERGRPPKAAGLRDSEVTDSGAENSWCSRFIQFPCCVMRWMTLGYCFGYCEPQSMGSVFTVEHSSIDMVVDDHASLLLVVVIWIFAMCT